jgi:ABC-2 type transport system permease protein
MRRYLRLYAHMVRFSFSRAMEFRVDFFFRVFMDALWYAVHLVFFGVIFKETQALGGWTWDQTLVFVASMFVMDAIQMTLFSNNTWWFPTIVNRGDLDYYLVRPVSSLFFVSLRDFAANSFLNLLLAIGIFAWALARYPEPLGALRITVFVLLLLAGVYLFYLLSMVFLIPVFWMQSRTGLREVFWSLERFGLRPHGIYHGWVRRVLVSLLPLALLCSYPQLALYEGNLLRVVLHTAAVVVGASFVVAWMWRRGLRAYASASS